MTEAARSAANSNERFGGKSESRRRTIHHSRLGRRDERWLTTGRKNHVSRNELRSCLRSIRGRTRVLRRRNGLPKRAARGFRFCAVLADTAAPDASRLHPLQEAVGASRSARQR